jgi:glyoxylase-like metal-dependent hydrolase (beta-lactamase superfamily II)
MGRSDELAAILVTRRTGPRGGAGKPSQRIVREEHRTFAVVAVPAHTGGHIAYADRAGAGEQIVIGRATLFGSRRNEGGDVLAAPRGWKNDFR